MNKSRIRLCFIGNMLGRNAGYITSQGQIVADLFAKEGYRVISASSKINRVYRIADIVGFISKNRKNIDVLILEVYSGLNMVIADTVSLLCRLFGISLIAVLHGGNLPAFIKQNPRWTTRILRRATRLVAPSSFLAETLAAFGFRVLVVPNVVETEGYQYRTRREISPNLIWMRSFHTIYNPQMAIKVLHLLKKDYPDAALVMAGFDKGLEDEVRKLADNLGLKDAVRFPGFLDLKAKCEEFSASDIYLNTNKIDNMPVALIEACATGVPVVATEVGGISCIIEHGENGLLIPDDDAESMAAAVETLLRNPDLTEKISKNGRRLAEKSSWQAVKVEWEKLFAEVSSESELSHCQSADRVSTKYVQ